ncbi:MAG: sensor histidine kinase [Candidatus Cyclobacteriaceae bacterium M2_1C_046]
MKIRLKLTLQFVLITALISCFAFIIIYGLSANFRQEQFYDRLYDKATNTAKLLVDVQEIDQELLQIIEENTASLYEETLIIYDFNDEIIYSRSEKEDFYEVDQDLINEVRLNEDIRYEENGRAVVGVLYSGEFDRFVVIASAFDKFGLNKISNLKWILIFVFAGILILTFIGGWIYSGQALKPITGVIEEVKQISDQNLSARVNEGNGTDEIAELAKTFNLMLNQLEEAFYSQKSFVSHASHELRTPLTAVTGQIEVALMSARSTEEYRGILKSVLEDIKGLSRLTNGLLDLVQTNPSIIIANFRPLRIDDILFEAMEQVKKKFETCQIIVDFEGFPEDEKVLIINGNDYLLKSAIYNLMENACKFSAGKEVRVNFTQKSGELSVNIQDRGIGISEKDIAQIFQPFYRADNASSFRGYGLGLPLAKRIFHMHNVEINLDSTLGKGTVFSLIFRKS